MVVWNTHPDMSGSFSVGMKIFSWGFHMVCVFIGLHEFNGGNLSDMHPNIIIINNKAVIVSKSDLMYLEIDLQESFDLFFPSVLHKSLVSRMFVV